MGHLAAKIRQRHQGQVLEHMGGRARDGAVVGEAQQIGLLLPGAEGPVVELEHHVGLALEPGSVHIGEEREQPLIAHLTRQPAAVALHEAVPHLYLVLLVEHYQADVQVLDYVHQPMKFTDLHSHSWWLLPRDGHSMCMILLFMVAMESSVNSSSRSHCTA